MSDNPAYPEVDRSADNSERSTDRFHPKTAVNNPRRRSAKKRKGPLSPLTLEEWDILVLYGPSVVRTSQWM
jgi:hypothetical protein